MSFGVEDKDWVDPDDEEPTKCRDCSNWDPCPCCGESGFCSVRGDWFDTDDGC